MSRVIHFVIPRNNPYVEMLGFLSRLKQKTNSSKNGVNPNLYVSHLKCIKVNRATSNHIVAMLEGAKLWKSNTHGVLCSFMGYRFYEDSKLPDNHFLLEYEYKRIPDDTGFPNTFPISYTSNTQRGAASIDR